MAGTELRRAMWVEKARGLAYWLLTLLIVASLGAIAAKPAYATTFTVNSTGNGNDLDFPGGTFDGSSDGTCDSNFTVTITCTLRAAIQEANASSTTNDTIDFNILAGAPGCNASGVCTISPTSRLPNITDTVIIDGYTQSGADDNAAITNANNAVLKIELSGANAGGTADGLTVAGTGAGGTTIKGLVINRFGEDGVVIFNGANAVIEGNFIGTNAAGDAALGNGIGVRVVTSGNRIGGPANAAQNIISGNDNHGVMVLGAAATGNSVLRNSIFGNGTPGGLGIALNNDGVTANDNKDPDGGPNLLQNFPAITSASTTTITGNLNSRPRKTFTIQFFSNPVPNFPTLFGEGETFLGEKTVRTNDRGKVSFTFATTLDTDEFVTATATDAAGNTSEFSQARTVE